MSLTKNDRKFRSKIGKDFPARSEPESLPPFVEAIAEALRIEFGNTPSTIKTVARMTNTNERTVKNWFDAKNGPSGENLVILMHNSQEVLQAVLLLSGHHDLLVTMKVTATKNKLREMLEMLDELSSSETP
ncbi:transposase family protein [Sphingomonas gilva]|uniref:transposase family protein n=1 Tax=Sphingomonas gilva TaxID=2305907 RepID=UPI0011C3DCDA|nr:transposase family protein [Sphingomonas gilva]